jgi:hypothetical protein
VTDNTFDNDDNEKAVAEPRMLQLTPRELQLVLKYGYPFPEEAELLRSSTVKKGLHIVHVDAYWIGMWIADIVRSAKTVRSQHLLEELDALCDVLETAENKVMRIHGV